MLRAPGAPRVSAVSAAGAGPACRPPPMKVTVLHLDLQAKSGGKSREEVRDQVFTLTLSKVNLHLPPFCGRLIF